MENKKKTPIILTIDDEDLVRKNFRAILEHYGYEVIEADNGADGIKVFEQLKPDMVLIDLIMPIMGGLEVLKHIHTSSSPNTPSIIISGTNSISEAVEALRLGAWDYIFKPIEDISILHHIIERNFERADLIRKNDEYHRHLADTLEQIHEDEAAGRKMQLKLLPPPVMEINDLTLERYFMPSDYLSGDFLDYFPINKNLFAFYSADVSGHGIPSALITIYLKTFMRKHLERYQQGISDTVCNPSELLALLNNQLIDEDLDKHLTLIYGLISTDTDLLTYVSAGQFPPTMLWQNGSLEMLQNENTAIGLFPDAQYSVSTKELSEDFFLAVFSDGILDALPQEALSDKLDFLKGLSNSNAITNYLNTLDSDHLEDDLTIVSIKRSCSYG
ncbi:MAG TPA: fused response regulator/phosphatase [Pontiella sp.]